jgi:hypothetical protein
VSVGKSNFINHPSTNSQQLFKIASTPQKLINSVNTQTADKRDKNERMNAQQLIHSTLRISYYTLFCILSFSLTLSIIILLTFEFVVRQEEEREEE